MAAIILVSLCIRNLSYINWYFKLILILFLDSTNIKLQLCIRHWINKTNKKLSLREGK